jgi:V/A-type H+-transporting ATPase subunit D
MPSPTRVPPGRAGRLWLRRRQAVAERGRAQLDRKLRILLPQQQSHRMRAARLQQQCAEAAAEAETWVLRAALLGGEDALRTGAPLEQAEARVGWQVVMGVSLPIDADVRFPPPSGFPAANAAVGPAAESVRRTVLLAVRLAAAQEALRRLDAEVAVTRRRLRAIETHWLPWLEVERARLEQALEQDEQDDGLRLRRAVAEGGSP